MKRSQAAATVAVAAFTGYAPWKGCAVGMNKIGTVRLAVVFTAGAFMGFCPSKALPANV